jgi:hypothetical protein
MEKNNKKRIKDCSIEKEKERKEGKRKDIIKSCRRRK